MYAITTATGFELRIGGQVPEGAIELTPEDYQALLAGTHTLEGGQLVPYVAPEPLPPTVAQQLARLDADNALSQRSLRETILLMAAAFETVTDGAVDLTKIPGVAKVAAVEAEAAALRAQL